MPDLDTGALNKLERDRWYMEAEVGVWPVRTLQDMRKVGDGPPCVKVRGRWLYRGGAILDWLSSLEPKRKEPK